MPIGTSDGQYFDGPVEQTLSDYANSLGINSYHGSDEESASKPESNIERFVGMLQTDEGRGKLLSAIKQYPEHIVRGMINTLSAPHDVYVHGYVPDSPSEVQAAVGLATLAYPSLDTESLFGIESPAVKFNERIREPVDKTLGMAANDEPSADALLWKDPMGEQAFKAKSGSGTGYPYPAANDNKNLELGNDPFVQARIDAEWNAMVKKGNKPDLKVLQGGKPDLPDLHT